MALSNEAANDPEMPEEIVAEIEGAERGDVSEPEPQTETIRLSRRKKEQQERDARVEALEADRAARSEEANRLRGELQSMREAQARTMGMIEQMGRQQPARETERPDDAMTIRDKIEERRRAAQGHLGGANPDLDAYHREMEAIMELKARAIIAAQPRPEPQRQAPQVIQKPAWVSAIEYQYPDVLSHPRGQFTVGHVEALIEGQFSPEKLHKMFARARTELGLKGTAAAPTSGQRQLHTGITSNGTGGRRGGDDRTVSVPKEYLAVAAKAGMSKAQAAKAWADSYPDEG